MVIDRGVTLDVSVNLSSFLPLGIGYAEYELKHFLMRRLIILLGCVWVGVSAGDYTSSHLVNCSAIPTNSTESNLAYLWDKAILHNVDRYAFLIVCPVILVLQLMVIAIYYQYSGLMQRSRNIFFGIAVFDLLINIHFLATSVYYTVEDPEEEMPPSFPIFCMVNAFYSAFLQIIHMEFMLLFPLYIIYILRFTLKNSKIWNVIYLLAVLIALAATIALYFSDLLGLSIFGLCSVSFIRSPGISYVPPASILVMVVVFMCVGLFSIRYFRRHMPNTVGLRSKKYKESRILTIYIVGYSIFLIILLVINIVELLSCHQPDSSSFMEVFITVLNLVRLSQFIFFFTVVFKNQSFRRSFKKFWKSKFMARERETVDVNKASSFFQSTDENVDFQELFLDIKEEQNQLDILKISQVVTIVSGIYVAYKQYFSNAGEYFHHNLSDDSNCSEYSHNKTKSRNVRPTRKIEYYEKMSIVIDSEIVKDYVVDLSLLPRLGVLACSMTIHAPKVFQRLLQNDNLTGIHESFQLRDNAKKMFDLVQGQGGRSGEFFFFSHDNKYVLKTITQNEFDFLEQHLSYFNEHFQQNPNSLLAKVYGLFTFKGNEIQRTYHLILMKNILGCSKRQIIRTYDLKGSKYDREVNIDDTCNELSTITLKDIDFMKMEKRLYIRNELKAYLSEIIERDTLFLKNLNLIDYSLLIIKVHWEAQPRNPHFWHQYQRIQSSVDLQTYYHIGVIDYLQRWDFQKKGEKWWKRLWGKKDISAQEPKKYQLRYMAFVNEIAETLNLENINLQLADLGQGKEEEQPDPLNSEFSDEREKNSILSLEGRSFQPSKGRPTEDIVKPVQKQRGEREQELFQEFEIEMCLQPQRPQ